MVCQSTTKTAKIRPLKNFPLYGTLRVSTNDVGQGLAVLSAPGVGIGGGNGSAVDHKHCACWGRPPGMAFFTKVQEVVLALFASAVIKAAADLLPRGTLQGR